MRAYEFFNGFLVPYIIQVIDGRICGFIVDVPQLQKQISVESKWELSHLICNWDSTTITNSRFIVVGVIKFRRGQSEKE
jgi:hypothetical protein